jgi:hypothetical protein
LYWKSEIEHFTSRNYDYTLRKSVEVPATRTTLSVYKEAIKEEVSGLRKIISRVLPGKKAEQLMLYEFMINEPKYLQPNDIKRIVSIVPNNPEAIIATVIHKCLRHPEFWSEEDRRIVIAMCQILYEIWDQPGEMAHLFLATCMLSADKTIINIAGEIWIRYVVRNKINVVKLGKMIGQHESIEFAPLKRFTDLVNQNLFRVSESHNRQLQVLLENIIVVLPGKPVRNLKKLLEIYRELLMMNKSVIELTEVVEKLEVWKETTGLQKIISPML